MRNHCDNTQQSGLDVNIYDEVNVIVYCKLKEINTRFTSEVLFSISISNFASTS